MGHGLGKSASYTDDCPLGPTEALLLRPFSISSGRDGESSVGRQAWSRGCWVWAEGAHDRHFLLPRSLLFPVHCVHRRWAPWRHLPSAFPAPSHSKRLSPWGHLRHFSVMVGHSEQRLSAGCFLVWLRASLFSLSLRVVICEMAVEIRRARQGWHSQYSARLS